MSVKTAGGRGMSPPRHGNFCSNSDFFLFCFESGSRPPKLKKKAKTEKKKNGIKNV